MSLPNMARRLISEDYKQRTPTIESNKMTALTATIQALGQSTGRAEKIYQDQITEMEQEIFNRGDFVGKALQ